MLADNQTERATFAEAPRRHWVTTLLAIWMFVYMALALAYNLMLYIPRAHWMWGPNDHPSQVRLWTTSILYTVWSLLDLLPTPNQLVLLREIVRHLLHLPNTYSFVREVFFRGILLLLPLALGYGLFRVREWARWGYTSLCFLAVGQWVIGWITGLSVRHISYVTAFGEPILAVALIVFLVRRGLTAKPRLQPNPAASAD
jgi:hypothetical protein